MRTLPERFLQNAENYADKTCFATKRSGQWVSMSWQEAADQVLKVSTNLVHAGIQPGDRVVLLAENRPEWAIFNLAIMHMGGIVVPAYTTHTEIDLRHIIDLCEPVAAIISTSTLTDRLFHSISESQRLKYVWSEDGTEAPANLALLSKSWAELEETPRTPAQRYKASVDDTCCLIFTSGTSGFPKAAMLTHKSIGANVDAAISILQKFNFGNHDRFLSFLPLAHSYEHTAGLHMPISMGAEIWFCEATDKLQQYLPEVCPTVATAVPRLYDLLYNRINAQLKTASPLKQSLFRKTLELGKKRFNGVRLSPLDTILDKFLDKMVRDKVRARFGGKIRYFISGGAALNPDVGEFFTALGVGIIQGYGQTEASPLISVNSPDWIKIDSVGRSFEGVDVELGEDHELLVRGDCLMKGYWNDDHATASTIIDGWLHTGDLATIDEDGFIRITGRKKDLIVTSGGENVSPSKIETLLSSQEEIEQAVVFGDGKPWLGAVIIPNHEASPHDHKQLEAAIKRVNDVLNSSEKVRKYVVQQEPCTTENGLLTPTQKVKRWRVLELNKREIEALY